MEELVGLAQYGYPGIVIAFIILISAVIYKMFGMVGNYQKLMDNSFRSLTDAYDRNTKVVSEHTESMKEIKEAIKNCRYNCR